MKLEEFINLTSLNGEEKEEARKNIEEAIKRKQFQYIEDFGFFSWKEIEKYGTKHIFIENMFIKPDKRNRFNLLCLRKWFREMYPTGVRFFYWKNRKKKKFFYCK